MPDSSHDDRSPGWSERAGIEPSAPSDGVGVATLVAEEGHLNRHGTVHGGAIATLCDVAMGAAVASLGVDDAMTIEMKVTYLMPADPGELRAEGRVVKAGERITAVTAQVTQGDDLVALATATFTGIG